MKNIFNDYRCCVYAVVVLERLVCNLHLGLLGMTFNIREESKSAIITLLTFLLSLIQIPEMINIAYKLHILT